MNEKSNMLFIKVNKMIAEKYLLVFLFLCLFFLSCDDLNHYEDSMPLPALHEAVEKDDIEEVKRLASLRKCSSDEFKGKSLEYLFFKGECFDVNYKHFRGVGNNKTAVFYVKSLEMLEFLFSQGAILKIRDRHDYSPLHFAPTPAIAKFYLDQGLDIEAKSQNGTTPINKAVRDNRIQTARFLFEQGANPYTETNIGWSALDRAEERSKWYTFSLNNLIEDFKAYTPPETTQVEKQEEVTQIKKEDLETFDIIPPNEMDQQTNTKKEKDSYDTISPHSP